MGQQDIIKALTNEWQTAKQIRRKLNKNLSTPLKKLREQGEIKFRYIKKGCYWIYEYRK